MIPAIDTIISSLQRFAEPKVQILTIYLFGSVLTRTLAGDVDVAILVDQDAIEESHYPLGFHAFLKDELSSALRCDNVDLLLLNGASPIIAMQVLRKGKKIFERDPRKTNEFFVRTVNRYSDLKLVRREIERMITSGRLYD